MGRIHMDRTGTQYGNLWVVCDCGLHAAPSGRIYRQWQWRCAACGVTGLAEITAIVNGKVHRRCPGRNITQPLPGSWRSRMACNGCAHWRSAGKDRVQMCHYLLDTGHRRPCLPGVGCSCHTSDRTPDARIESAVNYIFAPAKQAVEASGKGEGIAI